MRSRRRRRLGAMILRRTSCAPSSRRSSVVTSARARAARPVQAHYERGSAQAAPPQQHVADAPITPPPVVPRAAAPPATPASPPAQPSAPVSMDDEIRALLDTDPVRFMDLVSRSGTFPSVVHAPPVPVSSAAPTPSATAPLAQPPGFGPETVAQMNQMPSQMMSQLTPEMSQLQDAADRSQSRAPGSPIPGVSDPAWRDFVARLSRESPQFSSSRHVGQYRHRRERLAEPRHRSERDHGLGASTARRARRRPRRCSPPRRRRRCFCRAPRQADHAAGP